MDIKYYNIRIVSILTAFFIFLALCGTASAAQLYVNETGWWNEGGSFNSSSTPIQAAINNASTDDTIIVNSGTYYENVVVNKQLTLLGNNTGDGLPVVDAMQADHAITISADGVTLDGFIATNATDIEQIGIAVISNNNVIVNNNASSNFAGIILDYSDNNTLIGNDASLNDYGIGLVNSCNNTLTDNDASSNNDLGIILDYSDNNNLTGNDVSLNYDGIVLNMSIENNLTSNIVNNNDWDGIRLINQSNFNNLIGNTANNNGHTGIKIYYTSEYNMLIDNTENSNSFKGIYQFSSDNNIFINNTANDNDIGIKIILSNNNTFTNTTANNNDDGIELEQSSHNNFTLINPPDNADWEVYTWDNSINNTFDIASAISFTGKDFGIKQATSPASDPEGYSYIDLGYINATNNSADSWFFINRSYSDEDVIGLNESSLKFWRYDSTAWEEVAGTNGVNTAQNYVYANITSFSIFAAFAEITTLYVPDDYGKIQWAIDNASDGNTIIVDSGTYYENVVVNKQLTLLGNNTGDGLPVVDAMQADHAINISADGVTLDGFIATNATYTYIEQCGIAVMSDNNVIVNNNASSNFAGIVLFDSSNNNMTDNTASSNDYGIVLFDSSNNNLTGNDASLNNEIGIFLDCSASNNLTGNNASLNCVGIILNMSIENNLTSNIANDNTDNGIFLITSNSNNLTNNDANINSHGIYLDSSNDNTITDSDVNDNSAQGIVLNSSYSNTIEDNQVNSNAYNGILLESSSHNNDISGNIVNENGDRGILLDNSSNNNVTYNNASYNGGGILLVTGSQNNLIANNNASNNSNFGIDLTHTTTDNNQIYYNTANGNDINGINLNFSNDNTIIGNTANNNTVDGISLYTSNNNTLTGNYANNNGCDGIYLEDSNNNTLSENYAENNSDDGIDLKSSSNNTLTGNNANLNADRGITLSSSSNNTIIDNSANYNDFGIHLELSSENNNITDNTANSNDVFGIQLWECSYNTIENNNLADNGIGIFIEANSDYNNLANNNASNNERGICFHSASDNTLTDNTAKSNQEWDFYSKFNSINNTVTNLDIGSVISFTGKDIAIKSDSAPASDPSGNSSIGKFINATNNSADSWLFINVSYSAPEVYGMNESSLKFWKYNSTAWEEVPSPNGVNMVDKYVYANITSFSIFAPFAEILPGFLHVPDQYPTIQAAINAADDGDTVYVHEGTYKENVVVNKTNLTLLGENTGNGLPVVDAMQADHAINISADGVTLDGFIATNATISEESSEQCGIVVISDNNVIVNNNASSNFAGIVLVNSSNNNMTDNTASSNNYGIVLFNSSNNNLTDNNASDNDYGIYLDYSNNNRILSNVISNSEVEGIYTLNSSNNTITDNIIIYVDDDSGIWLDEYSMDNLVNDNYIENADYGIAVYGDGVDNNRVINNTIIDCQYGIAVYLGINNTLTDNEIYENLYGIYLDSSTQCTITGNDLLNNIYTGLSSWSSSENTISENNFTAPSGEIWENSLSTATVTVNGFNFFVWDGSEWVETAFEQFGLHYITESVTLDGAMPNPDGTYTVRIAHTGDNIDAAHIDYLAIKRGDQEFAPVSAVDISTGASILDKVSSLDNDVADVRFKTIEVTWDISSKGRLQLEMNAREEDIDSIRTFPFSYPVNFNSRLSNTYKTFELSGEGSMIIDGELDDDLRKPTYENFYVPDTGHPEGFTYIYLKNDESDLYIAVDITGDNTEDDFGDWVKAYIMVDGTPRIFEVTGTETQWGKSGFTYTDRVDYQHKVYELQIPLDEIGASPDDTIQIAFEFYGTWGEQGSLIYLDDSDNNTITGNDINGNDSAYIGINLYSSDNNTISMNHEYNATDYGLLLYNSKYYNITQNQFLYNDNAGIYIGYWAGGSTLPSPYSGSYAWFSGSSNNQDTTLTKSFVVTDPSMTFYHWYHTEYNCDGGVVEISDESGPWTKLIPIGGYPGMTYDLADCYAGSSNGWQLALFDLAPYIGHNVELRFRYVTDGSVIYSGWLVDNITINGVTDDIESGPNGWNIGQLGPGDVWSMYYSQETELETSYVTYNTVSGNDYGIYFEDNSNVETNIHHNIFYNNEMNAYDNYGTGRWDNGSEGNYWDDVPINMESTELTTWINTSMGDTDWYNDTHDNDYSSKMSIPFDFILDGVTYTDLQITSNGIIQLIPSGGTELNDSDYDDADEWIDWYPNETLIFAMCDDLDPGADGWYGYTYYSAGSTNSNGDPTGGVDLVVIDYRTSTYEDGDYVNRPNDFQVVLYANGTVMYNFQTTDFDDHDYDLESGIYLGQSSKRSVYIGSDYYYDSPESYVLNIVIDSDGNGIADYPYPISDGEVTTEDNYPLVVASQAISPASASGTGTASFKVTTDVIDLANVDVDNIALYYKKDSGAWIHFGDSPSGIFTFSTSSSGTYYFYTVSTDGIGKVEEVPDTYDSKTTISVSPVTKDGGGGGGGVGGSSDPENVNESIVLRIYLSGGDPAEYNFGNVVDSLLVTPKSTYGLVAARLEILNGKPGTIIDPPNGVIYKYINIYVGTAGWADDRLSDITINFEVPASWFEDNNIDPASVTLYRHNDGEWQPLATTLTGQAGGYYQYSVQSPGTSTFLIMGQLKEAGVTATKDTGAEPTAVEGVDEAETATPDKGIPGFGILLGIMGVLIAVYSRKK